MAGAVGDAATAVFLTRAARSACWAVRANLQDAADLPGRTGCSKAGRLQAEIEEVEARRAGCWRSGWAETQAAVRILGPLAVIATVCSKWAESCRPR